MEAAVGAAEELDEVAVLLGPAIGHARHAMPTSSRRKSNATGAGRPSQGTEEVGVVAAALMEAMALVVAVVLPTRWTLTPRRYSPNCCVRGDGIPSSSRSRPPFSLVILTQLVVTSFLTTTRLRWV